MRTEALARDGGEAFHLRGEAAIKVNEDQSYAKNADPVSCRQIVIGRKGPQGFAPDLGGEYFDARR